MNVSSSSSSLLCTEMLHWCTGGQSSGAHHHLSSTFCQMTVDSPRRLPRELATRICSSLGPHESNPSLPNHRPSVQPVLVVKAAETPTRFTHWFVLHAPPSPEQLLEFSSSVDPVVFFSMTISEIQNFASLINLLQDRRLWQMEPNQSGWPHAMRNNGSL
ncbi:hypothetical protein Q8A73_006156 [Channa argus]|nr:hypothetical protein Q8A73_006156 [Channa argus]